MYGSCATSSIGMLLFDSSKSSIIRNHTVIQADKETSKHSDCLLSGRFMGEIASRVSSLSLTEGISSSIMAPGDMFGLPTSHWQRVAQELVEAGVFEASFWRGNSFVAEALSPFQCIMFYWEPWSNKKIILSIFAHAFFLLSLCPKQKKSLPKKVYFEFKRIALRSKCVSLLSPAHYNAQRYKLPLVRCCDSLYSYQWSTRKEECFAPLSCFLSLKKVERVCLWKLPLFSLSHLHLLELHFTVVVIRAHSWSIMCKVGMCLPFRALYWP